jgi:uncharacterized protein (TIGR03382 family)
MPQIHAFRTTLLLCLMLTMQFEGTADAAPLTVPYSESFESGLGDWVQSTGDDFDWSRNSGSTQSIGTGPSSAYDGTWYIYTESSSPNYPDRTAELQATVDLQMAVNPMLSIYYHMYGASMGSLVVRVYTGTWQDIFINSGSQLDQWHQATIDLSSFVGSIATVVLQGTTGSSYFSDMAVDLITLSEASVNLTYSENVFVESSSHDGSVDATVLVTLTGELFSADVVSGQHVSVTNVPIGLTGVFTRLSDTEVSIALTGNALNHDDANDISDLLVSFENPAFVGGSTGPIAGRTRLLSVDFESATCGDALVYPEEGCDDANLFAGDGCDASCIPEYGFLCAGEPSVCESLCGDGATASDEDCDDGNITDGDGCSADCRLEYCGNGYLDGGELCDDGNQVDGDGCSADCLSDESCGNGVVDAALGEQCDDGGTQGDDGCSADCQLEYCGNGSLDDGELCDDGNQVDGDGCSADCRSEEICGNAVVDFAAGEQCDDGNVDAGDGCDADCLSEPEYACTGQPSVCEDVGGGASKGGCSAAGYPGGSALLLLLLFGLLRRRRR